jgi:putative membrane protein
MKRLSLWVATAFGTLTLPWLAWADVAGDGAHGYGHMMGGGWILGPVMMILFVAVIVAVVVLVVRWLGGAGSGGAGTQPKAALDILEERFARGEIDKDEFEARRQALRD